MLVFILNHRWGNVPPIGHFFSPFHGFWQNTQNMQPNLSCIPLEENVVVYWDDRHVPHILAKNDRDAYRVQGYITAYDRLWQMDFIARVAGGRVSEVVGIKALELDRSQRALGMTYAAEQALTEMGKDQATKAILDAYTQGVNAYISQVSPKNFPLEYKILGYSPEMWTPLKTCLTLKYMAWSLTGSSVDIYLSRIVDSFGKKALEELFPWHTGDTHPVIPKGTSWEFTADILQAPPEYVPKNLGSPSLGIVPFGQGSNNWAVDGTKTATGYPLLANDPHLDITLPSIWYETQLITPEQNVYGVTVPGAPAITIGFNSNIAWGVTNAYMDVCDWYEITFKDEKCDEYLYDGKWLPTKKREEIIKIRNESPIHETILYTHHGPVVRFSQHTSKERFPQNSAMRWTGHDPSNELYALVMMNKAKNYEDFILALERFHCPGQNFVFASNTNDIAIWHNGKFPIKWPGQGRGISDGSNSQYEWRGWIPQKHLPHIKNPSSHFCSSANQMATDTTYPYYMTGAFERFRNVRIQERLSEMKQITWEDFQSLQMDTKNLLAESVIPQMLKWISVETLTQDQKSVYECLKNWDFYHHRDSIAPTIFMEWWKNMELAIFQDELGKNHQYYLYPYWGQTQYLILHTPDSKWFDNTKTPEKETAIDLAHQTFVESCQQLYKRHGKLGIPWQWDTTNACKIPHLAKIPGLGREFVSIGGGRHIILSNHKSLGTSWRMVVSLEPEVKAWGIYPGGQSGNPGSSHYDDFVEYWRTGKLQPLLYIPNKSSTSFDAEAILQDLVTQEHMKNNVLWRGVCASSANNK